MTAEIVENERSPLLADAGNTRRSSRDASAARSSGGDPEANLVEEKSNAKLAALLIPLSVGTFFVAMDNTIVLSSYASIGSELKQLQYTSWIATSYMLTMTSFQPLYGKLSDIFGRKACLIVAYSIFALGCFFCGFARDMRELIAARAFTGIGGGGMTTIASIIMSDVIPLRSRGTWQGVMNIVFATGMAAGAPIGGFFVDSIGWRWSFLFQVPATTIAIIVVTLALNLPPADNSNVWVKFRRVDFAGSATLVLAVFFLLVGLDRGGNIAWNETWTITSLVLAALFSALFCTVETKWALEPVAPAHVALDPSLIAAYLVNFFGFAASMTAWFQSSLYFQAALGKSAAEAGVLLLPSIAGGVTGSLSGGLIMQALGKYYWLTIFAYVLMMCGLSVLAFITAGFSHSLVLFGAGLMVVSLGNGTGVTTTLIALISNAGSENQAVATALSYLFRSLGSVIGLSISSTITQDTLRATLHQRLTGVDVEKVIARVRESLKYIEELDPATKRIVRSSYETAVNYSFQFTLAMATLALVSAIFIKEKRLPSR
ncbi:hypothetical protein PLICRDRAFT_701711 [Plicaturopsis crispa FD-325 SS-3]|uniref:Unplaced genomic scaffold PLICRscaffold_17, whole genome shotgun sequence n=1 Tax=Plicaturopsis crispa FD-325 SS-3 TaxID=944288 RepID=A0A0C9SRB7_PLICR|nr:hypothetical protein PLICRDRAFT_701711 [Plicaturopsis crispa FD-325 SS-3]